MSAAQATRWRVVQLCTATAFPRLAFSMTKTFQNFIAGQWTAPESGGYFVTFYTPAGKKLALEIIRHLFAATADFRKIIAITGAFQNFLLFPCGLARKRIIPAGVERNNLRLARL